MDWSGFPSSSNPVEPDRPDSFTGVLFVFQHEQVEGLDWALMRDFEGHFMNVFFDVRPSLDRLNL